MNALYETSQSWIPKCPSYEEGYQSENCLFLEITVPERLVVEEFDKEGSVVEHESGAGCEKHEIMFQSVFGFLGFFGFG